MQVAGVDGFARGWVVVLRSGMNVELRVCADFASVLAMTQACRTVAIDMPIGFLDQGQPGGRACERAARQFVDRPRTSSVFSSPIRDALAAANFPSALAINRGAGGIGISKQAFCLFPKMIEIDRALQPAMQERLKEVHPEVCFVALRRMVAPNVPAFTPLQKKTAPVGQQQRERLLELAGYRNSAELITLGRKHGAAPDDVLDAAVAAWTAMRVAAGDACSLPDHPPHDRRGLEMAIWY
ncbi:MAG TPA: DUF429 domain-containing protein [Geminicoccus sp.]|uniref:DUF429 domain-containing protein n=1 Tax=Geminicoccus sp. TaxID=2024832 RepID=UPI002C2DC75F|nr:DUF429 domain-containing protein [Geminicoccus sp.]HWL71996.1 DUF429 domain-containing protein [Geminicoccus sp.]